jgi:ubiquinone/menaquinone biosynthesis C-methylase UbiE
MIDLIAEYNRYAKSSIMQDIAAQAHGTDFCGQTSSATFAQILKYVVHMNLNVPNILDLGCGNGTFAIQLAQHFNNQCEVHGVDLSEFLVETANYIAEKKSLQAACKFYVKDFSSDDILTMPVNQYNLIMAIGSMYWDTNIKNMLLNIKKLLAPNANLLIFCNMAFKELSPDDQQNIGNTKFIMYEEFVKALNSLGYSVENVIDDNCTYIEWLSRWNIAVIEKYSQLDLELGTVNADKLQNRFNTYHQLAINGYVKRLVLIIKSN